MSNRHSSNRTFICSVLTLLALCLGAIISSPWRDDVLAKSTSVSNQEPAKKGSEPIATTGQQKPKQLLGRTGKDHALLFATDDYDHWPRLNNPIDDARAIADELKNYYGFETEVLENRNEYSNPEYNLKYAAADAQAFAEELKKQQQNLGNYSSIKVIPLLDREATKANILLALKKLAGQESELPAGVPAAIRELKPAKIEDAVIVFFAGHGSAYQQRFYLIPHDLGVVSKRSEMNAETLKTIMGHSISDIDLEDAFDQIYAGHLLLVLDAANSGQALEAEEKRRGPMNSKGLAQLAYEKGMYILAASQSYQGSIELAQFQHGLLTYVLLEGLTTTKADTDHDGQVTALEWLNYATERVPSLQLELEQEALKNLRHHPTALRLQPNSPQDEPKKSTVQRPRVFYRQELETQPLIVARP
jgi:uncharacterized caspase-like protein